MIILKSLAAISIKVLCTASVQVPHWEYDYLRTTNERHAPLSRFFGVLTENLDSPRFADTDGYWIMFFLHHGLNACLNCTLYTFSSFVNIDRNLPVADHRFQHCFHQQRLEPLSSELGTYEWDANMAIALEEYAWTTQIYQHDLQSFWSFLSFVCVQSTWEIQACLEQLCCSLGSLHKEVELLVPFRIRSTGLWDLEPKTSDVKATILRLWWDNWAPNRLSFLKFLPYTDLALMLNITQSKINLIRYSYSSFWTLFCLNGFSTFTTGSTLKLKMLVTKLVALNTWQNRVTDSDGIVILFWDTTNQFHPVPYYVATNSTYKGINIENHIFHWLLSGASSFF